MIAVGAVCVAVDDTVEGDLAAADADARCVAFDEGLDVLEETCTSEVIAAASAATAATPASIVGIQLFALDASGAGAIDPDGIGGGGVSCGVLIASRSPVINRRRSLCKGLGI